MSTGSLRLFYRIEESSPVFDLVESCLDSGLLSKEENDRLICALEIQNLTSTELELLSKYLQKKNLNKSIFDVLKESHCVPQVGNPLVNIELDKKHKESRERKMAEWRRIMRARESNRDYQNLVDPLRKNEVEARRSETFSHSSQHATIGGGLAFTLFSASICGYFFGRFVYGPESPHVYTSMIVFCVVMFLIEALLIISKLSRIDAKRERGDGMPVISELKGSKN